MEGRVAPPAEMPSFAEVFAAYHGKVLAYARRMLGPDDAEDLCQEVFVKIDRSLSTLDDPGKLTSWIYAITLNAARDLARKRTRCPDLQAASSESERGEREEGEETDLLSRLPDRAARTPEEAAMRSEAVACYLDYVRQLPAGYYEVYALAELEHLANEEIARRLSLSVATVKIRLHRARARLFEQLRRACRCYYDGRGELTGTRRESA